MDTSLILASKSPRRAALLSKAGVEFIQVHPCEHAEAEHTDSTDIRYLAVENALSKARSVADVYPDFPVLSADTIVISPEGEVFGKPADEEDAFRILSSLSGTTHSVVTGIAFIWISRGIAKTHMEETRVTMRNMSREDIGRYIEDDKPFDKAGAYAIQEGADEFVDHIDGDFSNVVGLPVNRVLEMIQTFCAKEGTGRHTV